MQYTVPLVVYEDTVRLAVEYFVVRDGGVGIGALDLNPGTGVG